MFVVVEGYDRPECLLSLEAENEGECPALRDLFLALPVPPLQLDFVTTRGRTGGRTVLRICWSRRSEQGT